MKNFDQQARLANTNPSRAFPSLAQGFGLLGFILLFSIVIAVPVIGILGADRNSPTFDISESLIYCGSILLVIFYANRQRRTAHFEFHKAPAMLYILILFIIPAWIIIIEPVINLIPVNDWARKLFEGFRPDSFLKVAMIVVAAPLLEEFLFRGIILDGFLKRYSPAKAILLSSFLFGLIHLNPWQYVVAFGLGLMLGWIYWTTRSLMPCIFLHYVNNALVITLGLYQNPDAQVDDPMISDNGLRYLVFAVALLIFMTSAYLAIKLTRPNRINPPTPVHQPML